MGEYGWRLTRSGAVRTTPSTAADPAVNLDEARQDPQVLACYQPVNPTCLLLPRIDLAVLLRWLGQPKHRGSYQPGEGCEQQDGAILQ